MFWGDRVAREIQERYRANIKEGMPVVIRDEKTASGPVHIGSMRGVAIHGIISELLSEEGIANNYLYEINDFDAFDSVPAGFEGEGLEEHLGKPLHAVPAPRGSSAKNYAEHFGGMFWSVIEEAGFHPQSIRSSVEYKKGEYNEAIRTALERAERIRDIYKRVSGSVKEPVWLPIMMLCEHCSRVATTRPLSFDGNTVHYVCDQEMSGAHGCGNSGETSPFDGNAKLPWKIEWAAKFKIYGVHVEGSGKDLATRGGARDVANHIAREVFEYESPFDIPYEFFLVDGKKMSASKGSGASAREIADLMPSHILRLALLGKEPKRAFNFDPSGDTLPVLYDHYDTIAEKYFSGVRDDDTRLFTLVHTPNDRKRLTLRFLPRFAQIAFLVQMPHMNLEKETASIKGAALTEADMKALEERSNYASHWLAVYASEEFKYELRETLPAEAATLTGEQKRALHQVLRYIEAQGELDGQELHTQLHEIRKEERLEPKAFFSAIYLAFLGKESGPKAGWFLSVLDRRLLVRRLREASS